MSELNFDLLQENIRELLKKHDLTQSELAEIAGMSQGNLRQYRTEKSARYRQV